MSLLQRGGQWTQNLDPGGRALPWWGTRGPWLHGRGRPVETRASELGVGPGGSRCRRLPSRF